MATYADFVAGLYAEAMNKNTQTLPFLKASTVRQLRELSSIRTLFMEDVATFNTAADDATYTSAVSGFPVAPMQIDRLYYEVNGTPVEVKGPTSMHDLRFIWDTGTLASYPAVWGWHDETLWIAPKTAGVVTLKMDYFKDGRRDEATGALITTASTTQTNGWLDRGEMVLRNKVLAELYAQPAWMDINAAGSHGAQAAQAIAVLKTEWRQRRMHGGQAQGWFGGPMAEWAPRSWDDV